MDIAQLTPRDFLRCPTPQTWVQMALEQQDVLLIDHANCEKKAAATALKLMFTYIERSELQHKMSRLAREELRHFEQVLAILQKRDISYGWLSASRYARHLYEGVRSSEPGKLVDTLIVGAIIEARSCERFEALAPFLDDELSRFYTSLLKSEARHFHDYLKLAQAYSPDPIDARVDDLLDLEVVAIESDDEQFRFHSGVPVESAKVV